MIEPSRAQTEETFSSIIEKKGFKACFDRLKETVQNQKDIDNYTYKVAYKFAVAAHYLKRVGEENNQITPSEFGELLDKTRLKPNTSLNKPSLQDIALKEETWNEIYYSLLEVFSQDLNDEQFTYIVHGGSKTIIQKFLNGVQGVNVGDQGTQKCEGLWVAPITPENKDFVFSRAGEYASKSVSFFDEPTIMIAKIEKSALNAAFNDSYEKVIPLENYNKLSEISLYPHLQCQNLESLIPAGMVISFKERILNYTRAIQNVSEPLKKKLERWKW